MLSPMPAAKLVVQQVIHLSQASLKELYGKDLSNDLEDVRVILQTDLYQAFEKVVFQARSTASENRNNLLARYTAYKHKYWIKF